MKPIGDVMARLLERANTKIISEEVCQGCNREVKVMEMVSPIDKQPQTIRMNCECHKIAFEKQVNADIRKQEEERAMNDLERHSFIPLEIRSARINNYKTITPTQQAAHEIVVNYAKQFPQNEQKNIVFHGGFGTGKSHLLYSLCRTLAHTKKIRTLFITMIDLVDAVKSTWGRDSEESEQDVIRRMIEADFLVIDDVGAPMGSERMEQIANKIMFKIVNARIGKHTAFSTNLTLKELAKTIDPRTYDRVISNRYAIIQEINGPSGRQL